MRVAVLNFASNWWARFGDESDPHRFTRRAAYYNSTGIQCGRKMRRHWIVPGLIRFNGVGSGFNPHFPNRSIGHTFCCSKPAVRFGGNRLLFQAKAPQPATPDYYLVSISSDLAGPFDFTTGLWKSPSAQAIAASELRNKQEVLLLLRIGDWIRTGCGIWQLLAQDEGRHPKLKLVGDQPVSF